MNGVAPPASARTFLRRTCVLPPARIALLRFLTEGYDGLLLVRTLDPRAGLVEIAFAASQQVEAEALLLALAIECDLGASVPP
jgi:hypothetical protein